MIDAQNKGSVPDVIYSNVPHSRQNFVSMLMDSYALIIKTKDNKIALLEEKNDRLQSELNTLHFVVSSCCNRGIAAPCISRCPPSD